MTPAASRNERDAPGGMLLTPALKDLLRQRLAAFEVHTTQTGEHRTAAVALTVVEEGDTGAALQGIATPRGWSTEASILLTRRGADMRNHAGQWALPGGRIDAGEAVQQAALRELREEVGLEVAPEDVLGRLDDFVTRSGYVITPIVVWGGEARALEANPDEVASIHRIPITEFLRADSPMLEPTQDAARPVLRMPVGETWIAAPTAAILYQFREVCIAGREVRVAHFEQPAFAWR